MRLSVVAILLLNAVAVGADPSLMIDRTIGKQPKYVGKPSYCLLVFGEKAEHRVWLVRDGDTLYVDKNGNGDLTEAGEAVKKTTPTEGREQDERLNFEVGELKLGERTHKGLSVTMYPLAEFANSEAGRLPSVRAALAKDQKALTATIRCEVEVPGLKGGGTAGRLLMVAGWLDRQGPLQFADRPETAPVIHLGGPLEVNFYSGIPTMRVGRSSEFILVVGTPGIGPGTFAMLAYDDCIPETAYPKAEITFPPSQPGKDPVKELFELTKRC
jgi:hypothetical protein